MAVVAQDAVEVDQASMRITRATLEPNVTPDGAMSHLHCKQANLLGRQTTSGHADNAHAQLAGPQQGGIDHAPACAAAGRLQPCQGCSAGQMGMHYAAVPAAAGTAAHASRRSCASSAACMHVQLSVSARLHGSKVRWIRSYHAGSQELAPGFCRTQHTTRTLFGQ